MNILAEQIIELCGQMSRTINESPKFRHSVQKRQRDSKNLFVGQLMSLVAECRKMDLNQTDKAKFDSAVSKLNERLYEATSLII